MLTITVPVGAEGFNDETQEFVQDGFDLTLEHSLVSLSKWESKFKKPWLGSSEKTAEEVLWYIDAMVLTENPPAGILQNLSEANVIAITNYIQDDPTATTFHNQESGTSREVVTSELIYYWMTALNIPFECQFWHLNNLFTLIKVTTLKNAPAKKISKAEAIRERKRINEERRAAAQTKG
jgi:hypothetical protein